jgi:hypothetical protein
MEEVFKTYNNPLAFVRQAYPWREDGTVLQDRTLEKWQKELLDKLSLAIREKEVIDPNNYIIRGAVKSGQGIGKTTTLSWIIHWFMSTRQNPQVIVTANTENQLKNVVWRELSKWHHLAFNREWFEWTATSFYLKEAPESWKAVAIPYNESRPEAFQGVHAEDVLIIFDEASGVPEIIWDVVEGTIKVGRCIFLAFSNPTKNTGSFREAFGRSSHRWINVTVDSREVSFTNKEEIQQDIIDNGEDSDYIRIRVKGEFPRIGDTQFIGSDLIQRCFDYDEQFYHDFNVVIGVDVARFGDDESVICIRQGRKVHGFLHYRGLDGKQLAQYVVEQAKKWNTTTILVDGIGVGASPYDFLTHFGYHPIDVQSGERATDNIKYFNRRAEMYGKMKEQMILGLDIPYDQKLKEQLETITYDFANMKIKLAKKSEIKKNGFSSPDRADAVALTFAFDVNEVKADIPGHQIQVKRTGGSLLTSLTKIKKQHGKFKH